ncbi:MAG: hypothetical protein ABL959_21930, partial [Pyrinomonadaceae bacterium]
MLRNAFFSFLILLAVGAFGLVSAQTDAAVKPVYLAGDVVSLGDKKITVNDAKAGNVELMLTDRSAYKRVSAENASLTAATPGQLAEIGVGDRLTVSALPAADGKGFTARTVYYMTKADIDAKNKKEADAWRTRGITGKVISVNEATNQVVVETRTLTGSTNVTMTPKDGAKFLRYAQDSIRFDEAKASSLAEVKAGDMIRALGDKSIDGTSFAAEQVVAGAFQTIAGTVKSIDIEKREVIITDLQTKKDVTVVISDTSVVKKFPAEQAEMMARMQMGGAGMGGARPVGGGATPPQTPPAGGQTGQGGQPGGGRQMAGGPRGAGGGGVDEMLDRFPNITAADLKAGDMIAISSTKSGANTRIKAIKLLAGVEPFLRMAQAQGGRGGRGGGGV